MATTQEVVICVISAILLVALMPDLTHSMVELGERITLSRDGAVYKIKGDELHLFKSFKNAAQRDEEWRRGEFTNRFIIRNTMKLIRKDETEAGVHGIVMTAAEGEPLDSRRFLGQAEGRRLSRKAIWFIASKVLEAVEDLCRENLVHHDIHAGNVIVKKGKGQYEGIKVTLIDLGEVGVVNNKYDRTQFKDTLRPLRKNYYTPVLNDCTNDVYNVGLLVLSMMGVSDGLLVSSRSARQTALERRLDEAKERNYWDAVLGKSASREEKNALYGMLSALKRFTPTEALGHVNSLLDDQQITRKRGRTIPQSNFEAGKKAIAHIEVQAETVGINDVDPHMLSVLQGESS